MTPSSLTTIYSVKPPTFWNNPPALWRRVVSASAFLRPRLCLQRQLFDLPFLSPPPTSLPFIYNPLNSANMKATSAATPTPPLSSRRSQPMRQARANPSRRSTLSTVTKNARRNISNVTSQQQQSVNQRFYPALASFTDSIDALPAEIIRNFTLLREVDAKACHPEEQLRRYIAAVKTLPPPADPNEQDLALEFLRRQEDLEQRREDALSNGENAHESSGESVEHYPETRRSRLQQIRMVLQDLLPMLDEKIHVITGTAEALNKHNLRVDQAYAYVQSEIPEMYRTGNPDHWGYKPNPPKGSARSAAAQVQATIVATQIPQDEPRFEYSVSNPRVDARREARRQGTHVGLDDEDHLQPVGLSKRPHGNSRVKNLKEVDTATQRVSEMALSSLGGTLSAQSAKRRKPNSSVLTEKSVTEKSGNTRGTTSPRAGTPTVGKRTTKGTVTASTTTGTSGRRR